MQDISISKLVEMIVYCPDWREKRVILERHVKQLVKQEHIDQIRQELNKMDKENEEG